MKAKEALKGQYHASLAMLRDCIEKCPDEVWVSGTHPRNFWRITFHTLYFADLYLAHSLETWAPWEKTRESCRVLWEDDDEYPGPPQEPPYSRQELLEYLFDIDSRVDSQLDEMDLNAPTCGIPWYSLGKLEHQIVNIRHIGGHVGQLSELLMAHGIDTAWAGSRKKAEI